MELSSAHLAQILHIKCPVDTYLVCCAGGNDVGICSVGILMSK